MLHSGGQSIYFFQGIYEISISVWSQRLFVLFFYWHQYRIRVSDSHLLVNRARYFFFNYKSGYIYKPTAKRILSHRKLTKQKADRLGSSVPEEGGFRTVLNKCGKFMSCLSTLVRPWRFTKIPNAGDCNTRTKNLGTTKWTQAIFTGTRVFDMYYPVVLARKASFIKRVCASLWAPVGSKNRLPGNRIWW